MVARYRIDPSRSQAATKALIGENFGGFVISDRYAGYHFLDVLQHQLCWCHVIRQLVDVSQRSGAPGRCGAKLVSFAREVIAVMADSPTITLELQSLGLLEGSGERRPGSVSPTTECGDSGRVG